MTTAGATRSSGSPTAATRANRATSVNCTGGAPHSAAAQDRDNRGKEAYYFYLFGPPEPPRAPPERLQGPQGPGGPFWNILEKRKIENSGRSAGQPASQPACFGSAGLLVVPCLGLVWPGPVLPCLPWSGLFPILGVDWRVRLTGGGVGTTARPPSARRPACVSPTQL